MPNGGSSAISASARMLLVVASPSPKLNASSFADQIAASIAFDEIACPQRRAIGQFDGDASVVLRETR